LQYGQDRWKILSMIYHRSRKRSTASNGCYRFENVRGQGKLTGFGIEGIVRLRDEYGVEWAGTAELQDGGITSYRLRSPQGATMSGISDGHAILLRDERGNAWRGFVD
jgi:hypothetical protein